MKSNDETKCGEADRNRLQSIVSLLIGLFQNTEVIMSMATSMLVTGIGGETCSDNFGCWLWIKYISKITKSQDGSLSRQFLKELGRNGTADLKGVVEN